jgi:hypothetical protein
VDDVLNCYRLADRLWFPVLSPFYPFPLLRGRSLLSRCIRTEHLGFLRLLLPACVHPSIHPSILSTQLCIGFSSSLFPWLFFLLRGVLNEQQNNSGLFYFIHLISPCIGFTPLPSRLFPGSCCCCEVCERWVFFLHSLSSTPLYSALLRSTITTPVHDTPPPSPPPPPLVVWRFVVY